MHTFSFFLLITPQQKRKSPVKSLATIGGALHSLLGFLFAVSFIQEEERKSVYFSRQKNVKGGVLIFVVADIWNCYNMDMFKLRYKQEYSADLSKNIIATAS